jgi:DNA-binding SARP family transcriptional activator
MTSSAQAEFKLLGDVEAWVGDRPVAIGHARQRAVFAVLLIEADRCVPVDNLVDRVWAGHRLPSDPVGAVRTYVSLLRRAFRRESGAAHDLTIVRRPGGYHLAVDALNVDLHRFHTLLRQAREAGDDRVAAARLDAALHLWRGDPFVGLDTVWFTTVRVGLLEMRRLAQLDLVDAKLRLGEHVTLVAELSGRVAAHPLDERVVGQFMTALYRSGRQADAFAEYQRIRRRLVDAIGAGPGEQLRTLHQALLADEPAVTAQPPR